jgi:hypothetical protein
VWLTSSKSAPEFEGSRYVKTAELVVGRRLRNANRHVPITARRLKV